ncbi:tRNA pseudouridine(55) synthase TruB [Sporosarcina sp. Te-1]|uniref:tRNA pseudouridine(55) synthase TruB n=1 Tax=Sporosarcina sp. Te-1 TaxID=2818390 RepID=UPI001A9E1253|nr:tRNA pseudouridine(55) synthase TruB [Sporosarcina sp. Te-1]QTD42284.1 tRNA pseudouridine(55) synthase TruB [Sporosarcina sp. Te-1]
MDGILPLWKEKGMTSHDCVFKLRKILGMKRIGHTGTLDPNVEGVLPICIGQATKVAEYITDAGKEYMASVTIGSSTETEDADGDKVLIDSSFKSISRSSIVQALQQLTGEIIQVPPMYSAVKVNGRKLYEYARKGLEVERPQRKVNIYDIELLDEQEQFEGEEITFAIRVACGKGTYIRTLAVQIGELLGYPAHMSSLVRTMSGTYTESECLTLEETREQFHKGQLDVYIRPLEDALAEFPSVEMDAGLLDKISNGQVLQRHAMLQSHDRIVFIHEGKALAVYKNHPSKTGMMKPEKMFSFHS